MNSIYLLLSLSYITLILFVVWAIFGKRFTALQKIIICGLLPLVYFLHWTSLQDTKGWPSDQTLPLKFELISADVVEPNSQKSIKGEINLWIRPTDDGSPRAYVLPYSRALHKKLFETKQRSAAGKRQIGLMFDEGSGQKGVSVGGGMKLNFRDAPPTRLPPKRDN